MSTPRTHVQTGKSIFIPWAEVDNMFNAWAKRTFGSHAYASADRDEDVLEIKLMDLKMHDFEAFAKVYEAHDQKGEFEPDFDFHAAPKAVNIPTDITRSIVSDLLVDYGLAKCGEAVPNYKGVFFTENRHDGSDDPDIRYTVEGITDSAKHGWFRTSTRPGGTMTAAINVDCPQGTIMAEVAGDYMYPGIYLVAKDNDGNERTMVLLERSGDDKFWLYIYGDKDNDDWTERIPVEYPEKEEK